MKNYFFLLFFNMCITLIYSTDTFLNDIDKYNHDGQYEASLRLLEKKYADNTGDIKVAWKLAQTAYLIAENIKEQKIRHIYYEKGITAAIPFLENTAADKRDRVEVIQWYMVNYASKIKELGIFAGREGLDIIPQIFKAMERSIMIDPEYAGAYFFRGKFYGEIPGFLGGNKLKMEMDYVLALKYAPPEEINIYRFEIANAILKRNWSLENKLNEAKKQNIDQFKLLSLEIDDYHLAMDYLAQIIKALSEKNDLSFKENAILNDTKVILAKKK